MTTVYPHIVIRWMSCAYGQRIVTLPPGIVSGEPIPPDVRAKLIAELLVDCKATGLRMCLVFGEGDAVYCNPDGTPSESTCLPSGGVRVDEVSIADKGYGPC
jgi:hypothetical protein